MLAKSYQANRERSFVTDGQTDVCGDISPVQQMTSKYCLPIFICLLDDFILNVFICPLIAPKLFVIREYFHLKVFIRQFLIIL